MEVQRDRHHILHTGKEWLLRPESRSLRNTPQLIPTIDRDVHDELHRISPAVPLLSFYVMQQTVSLFEPKKTTIETIDNLMMSIEHASRHYRTHPIERDLAQLAIQTIELQRAILCGNVDQSLIIKSFSNSRA